jgi:hypothetical protein
MEEGMEGMEEGMETTAATARRQYEWSAKPAFVSSPAPIVQLHMLSDACCSREEELFCERKSGRLVVVPGRRRERERQQVFGSMFRGFGGKRCVSTFSASSTLCSSF